MFFAFRCLINFDKTIEKSVLSGQQEVEEHLAIIGKFSTLSQPFRVSALDELEMREGAGYIVCTADKTIDHRKYRK